MRPVTKLRRAAAFLLAALAAAATFSAPAQGQAKANAPADPARAAAKQCGSSDAARERECYWKAIEARLASGGAAAALTLLDTIAALDPDVRRDGHQYAHRIGIFALPAPSEVGRVFATCTPAYQSGCYHGVIQSYFLSLAKSGGGGVTAQSVEALCSSYRGSRADLLFQCTHGMGHGLTMLHRHDLPKALASCDLLSRADEREMCWAGAFMESLVNATHPHHAGPPEAPAKVPAKAPSKPPAKRPGAAASGHDGHAGHGPEGAHDGHASAAAPFKALDPADLHYPCSKMDEKYLVACYTLQTSAMLHHTGQDVGRTAAECGRAPEKARVTCFVSLGRDVSTISLGNNAQAAQLCGLSEAAYRAACHRGVVESIVNMNADPSQGIPYCRLVAEAEGKRACYVAVGQQALVLPDGEAKRTRACGLAEEAMRNLCLNRPKPESGA